MVNLTYPELSEAQVQPLPAKADIPTLKRMRDEACQSSLAFDFKLQPQQRFLRRVLSPDAPTQGLLMVHGTGTGKTCTAIQIAEEYILRPEFQDKRVLVLANPSVQDNFKGQIFDIDRVSIDPDGVMLSKQCTGRRYLDILKRSMPRALRSADAESRDAIKKVTGRILKEFYEFQGYAAFGNELDRQRLTKTPGDLDVWIHETFDHRLVIIDEAHNLRTTTETDADAKIVSDALRLITKKAVGMTLVLLTATPMYDQFDEIMDYFNFFLWNEKKQASNESLKVGDFFSSNGDFLSEERESMFRTLCDTYVSYVRGENPFTFPFRLPPPAEMVVEPRSFLTLTGSVMSQEQATIVEPLTLKAISEPRLICTLPDGKSFQETFQKVEDQFRYKTKVPFLAPSKVGEFSAKFKTIVNCIDSGKGVTFVYSNIVEQGAQLFAMCLEEHGFQPAFGSSLIAETSGEVRKGSKGKYVLFTSDTGDAEIKRALTRLRRKENANGEDIRVIIASPKVSEGVDFKYVRQIHILDPWFNMSRIEQVIGRGMRTCSHSALPFEEQNCTVYLHVCKFPDDPTKVALDEKIYRDIVEPKGIRIAKIKQILMESAMDCSLEKPVNVLPKEWANLDVQQIRSQNGSAVTLKLKQMTSPSFLQDDIGMICDEAKEHVPDPDHVRPLSAILDVKDEVLDTLMVMFAKKPVWKQTDVVAQLSPLDDKLVKYLIQNAIKTGFQLKDGHGRIGYLETKKGMFAFRRGTNDTLMDRVLGTPVEKSVSLEEREEVVVPAEAPKPIQSSAALDMSKYTWPAYATDFPADVKTWYYVDHALKEDARIAHFLGLNWNNPPVYAAPLKFQVGDKTFAVLGSGKIYDVATKTNIGVPIGAEADAYKAWVKTLKDAFVASKDQYFGTMIGDTLGFNLDDKSKDVLKRAERSKNIGGRKCMNYDASIVKLFSQWLGSDFPKSVKVKEDRCGYVDMLIRRSVLEGRDGLKWWTPEQWEILSEEDTRKDLLKRLK
jgi:hypothetical protein